MPKPTKQPPTTPTTTASNPLPALPAKRARRRTTRGSHAWRFRRPPSRKRVEVAMARFQPQAMLEPQIAPLGEAQQ